MSVVRIWWCALQDKKTLQSKEKEISQVAKDLEKLQHQSNEDQEAYTAAQNRFQAVSAGLSSNTDGEDATLNDQLLSKS